jgi:hypothetical protein
MLVLKMSVVGVLINVQPVIICAEHDAHFVLIGGLNLFCHLSMLRTGQNTER